MSRPTDFPRHREPPVAGAERAGRLPPRSERSVSADAPLPRGRSSATTPDASAIAAFGAGLTLGLVLGAGATLLLAPQAGEETRDQLGAGARRIGGQVADRWDDLRDELRWMAHRGRRSMRRGLARGRWMAEDVADRGRHRFA